MTFIWIYNSAGLCASAYIMWPRPIPKLNSQYTVNMCNNPSGQNNPFSKPKKSFIHHTCIMKNNH